MGFSNPYMPPGMYGYPSGPVVMPMWGYPGPGPGGMPLPGQHFGMQLPTMNLLTSSDNTTSNMAPIIIPDIVAWFSYLDWHEEHNKDGIIFAPFGHILKMKGFLQISQLTLDFVKLEDLQTWLGIEVGTAIFIMQYAKEDMEALKSRKWVFPNNYE